MSTQGAYEKAGMAAHYKDLRELYAKRMECHGNGMGLMHPISGEDCQPVSCGYFDRNGDWNLITRLTTNPQQTEHDWVPLENEPKKSADVLIEWQPKTSLGVQAVTMDASGDTPDNLPGGADAHIKYSSNNKFGAVLMTKKPVKLHAYNDERLFMSWLEANKEQLYTRYGGELKKYGLWIVTRTYCTSGASVNAWLDGKKDAVVSLKAKANMLGELGEDLSWQDKMTDKDWCHYTAKTDYGIVVFLDGIEIKPLEWWKEGLKYSIRGRSRSNTRSPPSVRPTSDVRRRSEGLQPPETARPSPAAISRGRPRTLVADADDETLKDAGLDGMSRSISLRRLSQAPSVAPSLASSLTPSDASISRSRSLRRETRSISRDLG